LLHTQEVTGSSPVPPTIAPLLNEELGLRELLETLLGPEGRRKLRLRTKSNDELFILYDSDLMLRVHNARTLDNERRLLAKFHGYLNNFPPSPELAKGFLSQYVDRKPRTLARYASTIKSFMRWYGEPLDDYRVRLPQTLPPYTEDSDVEKLFDAIENKATHKHCVARDALLVSLALKSGLRRAELANLATKDIHEDFLVVRAGKGQKDRVVPLVSEIATKLHDFTKGMKPDDNVFNLKATSIGNKIRRFAKKAGLKDFHTHSMRHKFATDLLNRGANIKQVQELLGHARLDTTQVYLAVTGQGLRDAVNLLNSNGKQPARKTIGNTNTPKWIQELDRISGSGKNYIIRRNGVLEEL